MQSLKQTVKNETTAVTAASLSKQNGLNLNELSSFKLSSLKKFQQQFEANQCAVECILCDLKFSINSEVDEKSYLAHLIEAHRVVIADVHLIGDLKRHMAYWKERFKSIKLEEVCFTISTNTGKNDRVESENFFLLSDDL